MAAAPTDATIVLSAIEAHPDRRGDAEGLDLARVDEAVDQLVVSEGPNAGTRYSIGNRPLRAGRSVDADVFLDDVTVSRAHAEFTRGESGGVILRDVGSLNGTYVNRSRVDLVELTSGDEVQIGKFKMIFVAGDHHQ